MSFGEKEKQLLSAIRHYRTTEALALLEEELDLDSLGFFPLETPLLLAIRQGNKTIIRKLVEKGADVNHVVHWHSPKNEELLELSEGHDGREVNEHKCPLSEALCYEEKHNLTEEIALLKAHGAKELYELLDK